MSGHRDFDVAIVFFTRHGSIDPVAYFEGWFASMPATQITVDIALAFVAFALWAAWEGRRLGMRSWWMPVPASLGVGLCFALPLFLFRRDRRLSEVSRSARTVENGTPAARSTAAVI